MTDYLQQLQEIHDRKRWQDILDWETSLNTPEICLRAVSLNGENLGFIKEEFQTPELCLIAVNQNGRALPYVIHQTPEICIAAVMQKEEVLCYVRDQTPEICIAAVSRRGSVLTAVIEQTPEICLAAVKQNGEALCWVKEQTPEICLAAVMQTGMALCWVREPTLEICQTAYSNDPLCIDCVPFEMRETVLTNAGSIEEGVCVITETVATEMHRAMEPTDPLTMDTPTAGVLFAFREKGEALFPVASLDSVNYMIKNRYRGSTLVRIFSPLHNEVIPVSEIRWVRF